MFNIKQSFVSDEWKNLLESARSLDIESVSQRKFDWFEAPNRRRGGWSGVSRIVLNPEAPDTEQKAVLLKIRQNHLYIAPNTYFLKRLTFKREFAAMTAIRPHCEAIPAVVLFAHWEVNGDKGSVLITDPWTTGFPSARG